jgi:hypothetical protein
MFSGRASTISTSSPTIPPLHDYRQIPLGLDWLARPGAAR